MFISNHNFETVFEFIAAPPEPLLDPPPLELPSSPLSADPTFIA